MSMSFNCSLDNTAGTVGTYAFKISREEGTDVVANQGQNVLLGELLRTQDRDLRQWETDDLSECGMSI